MRKTISHRSAACQVIVGQTFLSVRYFHGLALVNTGTGRNACPTSLALSDSRNSDAYTDTVAYSGATVKTSGRTSGADALER